MGWASTVVTCDRVWKRAIAPPPSCGGARRGVSGRRARRRGAAAAAGGRTCRVRVVVDDRCLALDLGALVRQHRRLLLRGAAAARAVSCGILIGGTPTERECGAAQGSRGRDRGREPEPEEGGGGAGRSVAR